MDDPGLPHKPVTILEHLFAVQIGQTPPFTYLSTFSALHLSVTGALRLFRFAFPAPSRNNPASDDTLLAAAVQPAYASGEDDSPHQFLRDTCRPLISRISIQH